MSMYKVELSINSGGEIESIYKKDTRWGMCIYTHVVESWLLKRHGRAEHASVSA